MVIRKLFKFEGAHIVRNCSSHRCRENIHGHSYIVEVFITSDKLDRGYMVMDFVLLDKVKELVDSFDHTYSLWQEESDELKTFIIQALEKRAPFYHQAHYIFNADELEDRWQIETSVQRLQQLLGL